MADTAWEVNSEGESEKRELPRNFRKMDGRAKRAALADILDLSPQELHTTNPGHDMVDLAEVMVESAVGVMPVPMGIATGFLIDDEIVHIPMAVEEPSVIAAATFAGSLIARNGGFTTVSTGQVMTAQIIVDKVGPDVLPKVEAAERQLHAELTDILGPMTRRGGGYRGIDVSWLEEAQLLIVYLHVDTRDAMGANIINTAAEALRQPLEAITGGSVLMAILTNAAHRRRVQAHISLPVSRLARGDRSGEEMGHRLVRANDLARANVHRAVTHNKGIMNGISALALATGNDTRAVEAAAHAWAARDGIYRGLTTYEVVDDQLHASLEVPLALGTTGGAVGFHPATRFALALLFMNSPDGPSAERLSRVAVALGLAQNMAALLALVGEGIQRGHMRQHARRLAWSAGARKEEIPALAERLWENGTFNRSVAEQILRELRSQ